MYFLLELVMVTVLVVLKTIQVFVAVFFALLKFKKYLFRVFGRNSRERPKSVKLDPSDKSGGRA